MQQDSSIRKTVRSAAAKKMLFLPHAARQMSRPERMIAASDVRNVVTHGEVIENYPEDQRGHSCLMLGFGKDGRPIHVVCSPRSDYLAIITAYLPNKDEWSNDYKSRRWT